MFSRRASTDFIFLGGLQLSTLITVSVHELAGALPKTAELSHRGEPSAVNGDAGRAFIVASCFAAGMMDQDEVENMKWDVWEEGQGDKWALSGESRCCCVV